MLTSLLIPAYTDEELNNITKVFEMFKWKPNTAIARPRQYVSRHGRVGFRLPSKEGLIFMENKGCAYVVIRNKWISIDKISNLVLAGYNNYFPNFEKKTKV